MKPLLVVDRGEFGWSLCVLAPRAAVLADGREVVVVAPRDRWPLFDDFAALMVESEPEPGTQDFLSGGLLKPSLDELRQLSLGRVEWPMPAERAHVVRLERASFADAGLARAEMARKSWRRFGSGTTEPGTVCVAFRPPKLVRGKVHEWKAWPSQRCAELAAALVRAGRRVVAVGGPDNWCPEGAEDARGRGLLEQGELLSRAEACVGPSSGTMHFAHMAGCPVVTWYDAPESSRVSSESRYRLAWNPFAARLEYLRSRCPSAPEVLEAVERIASRGAP